MKKSLSILLALILFVLPGYSKSTHNLTQISSFEDSTVHIKSIPHPCFWINKPKDFKLISNNSLSITAGKETDFYTFVDGSYYVNNVPKLLFKPDTNFIFTAKLNPAFAGLYDGAALLIYSDEGNWAKLLFENNDGNIFGVGSSIVKNKITDDSYHAIIKSSEVYLRIAKSDRIFCFYYSLDGKTWNLVRTFAYTNPADIKIGFYVQSPKGQSLETAFSNITYKGVKFTNFFTGE